MASTNRGFGLVELVSHPTSRSQARTSCSIAAGTVILSIPAYASILLEQEKGRRCDACFRIPAESHRLNRCTGCASYYYCNTECQLMHWKSNHKRICKVYNKMESGIEFHTLAHHEKMDVLLLSDFLARASTTPLSLAEPEWDDPLSTFMSLLPSPQANQDVVRAIPTSLASQPEFVQSVYSRFSNNNFTVHSHMNTIGHGVFPLASRLFNHSCLPNAAPRYILSPSHSTIMEVVALRDISAGEQICMPYIDPALTQARHQAFQYTYNFTCDCDSCLILRSWKQLEKPTSDQLPSLSTALRDYTGINLPLGTTLPSPSLKKLPVDLRCVLHESFMEQISEQFSKASHEGEYETAVVSGLTLLALYLLIYPVNYPQTGLHLLELTKTGWNWSMSSGLSDIEDESLKSQVRTTLEHAKKILSLYGAEGDEFGPLDEIQQLENLLND